MLVKKNSGARDNFYFIILFAYIKCLYNWQNYLIRNKYSEIQHIRIISFKIITINLEGKVYENLSCVF